MNFTLVCHKSLIWKYIKISRRMEKIKDIMRISKIKEINYSKWEKNYKMHKRVSGYMEI